MVEAQQFQILDEALELFFSLAGKPAMMEVWEDAGHLGPELFDEGDHLTGELAVHGLQDAVVGAGWACPGTSRF